MKHGTDIASKPGGRVSAFGMDGMVVVSIAFVAGVGLAAAMFPGLAHSAVYAAVAGALSLLAAAGCLAILAGRHGRGTGTAAALFLLLGIFTWSAHYTVIPASGFATPAETPGQAGSDGAASRTGGEGAGSRPGGDGGRNGSDGMARDTPPVRLKNLPAKALSGFSAAIDRLPFPHPETNALLRALLTGQRDRLDRHTKQSFRAAGASHILALSGLHLGIIYLILSKILSLLGNSRRAWILRSGVTVSACGFYTLITGAGPSIVRAFLFITLAEIARNCPGRRKSPLGVWCTALMLQLCAKPGLIASPGFQLSYLAMLGIFLPLPVLKSWYPSAGALKDRLNPVRRIWEGMALALCCQMFTAPVVWIHFRSFPKYFLLSNLISVPLTGMLLAGGLVCILAESLGSCPRFLLTATDLLSEALRRSLEIIATM